MLKNLFYKKGISSLRTKHPEQLFHRIIKSIHHPFFKRDYGVIGNRNVLRANCRTAFGDITEADSMRPLQIFQSIFNIKWMHFQCSRIYQETRTDEFIMKVM